MRRKSLAMALARLVAPFAHVARGRGGAFLSTDGPGNTWGCAIAWVPKRATPLVLARADGRPRLVIGTGWGIALPDRDPLDAAVLEGDVPEHEIPLLLAAASEVESRVVFAHGNVRILGAAGVEVAPPACDTHVRDLLRAMVAYPGRYAFVRHEPRNVTVVPPSVVASVLRDLEPWGMPPPPFGRRRGIGALGRWMVRGRVDFPAYDGVAMSRADAVTALRSLLAGAPDGGFDPPPGSQPVRIAIADSRLDAFLGAMVEEARTRMWPRAAIEAAIGAILAGPRREGRSLVFHVPCAAPLGSPGLAVWCGPCLTWP